MTLIVAPLKDAVALVAGLQARRVLSLVSPDAPAPIFEGLAAPDHLILRFNDIVVPTEGLLAPDRGMMSALLAFGGRWDGMAPFLVHCWAGISRSTAAAYILACQRCGSGAEHDLAQALRRESPSATPNALMVALADELLARRGAMTHAIARIGRGAEASFGLPFSFGGDGSNFYR